MINRKNAMTQIQPIAPESAAIIMSSTISDSVRGSVGKERDALR
jgi:hypothetical protein